MPSSNLSVRQCVFSLGTKLCSSSIIAMSTYMCFVLSAEVYCNPTGFSTMEEYSPKEHSYQNNNLKLDFSRQEIILLRGRITLMLPTTKHHSSIVINALQTKHCAAVGWRWKAPFHSSSLEIHVLPAQVPYPANQLDLGNGSIQVHPYRADGGLPWRMQCSPHRPWAFDNRSHSL